MCGICGIIVKEPGRQVDQRLIERMTDVISHRGPDDSGYYLHQNIAFGHRRLSIVDLAHGHQPMRNIDRTQWIVYNGEVYNHDEIRKELTGKGYLYQTRCDTESIINCIDAFGSAGLHKMRGMFAFAIHNQRSGKVFIARDRLGIKPLYYVDTPEYFAFASEIKSLLQIPGLPREVDDHALYQILALKYTCDDATLFAGIKRLAPGHYLEYSQGTISVVRYWDFGHIKADNAITEEDAARQLRTLMDQSINLRLMSDVPLGMFLSGGIDSTIIAERMAKMVDRRIATFSVAFKERDANELEYARAAAAHANADQHEVVLSTTEFFELLPRMIYHEDEPIAHPSSVALYKVSELASKHVKVVLTGEGSDELFGGYEKYYQTLMNLRTDQIVFKLLPRALRRLLFRPLIDALPYKFPYRNKALRTTIYLDEELESIFLDNYATFPRPQLYQLLSAEEGKSLSIERIYSGFLDHFHRSENSSLLSKILYADIKTYLHELLMKQDQMSMAASIESRVPFLDHHMVEFAFSLPDELKIKGFQTKRVLRTAFASDIPQTILTRPKKGFPVPIKSWFAGEYHNVAREIVLGKDSFCSQRFNRKLIEKYFELHRAGKYNYSDQIWTLLNLELWHKIFIAGSDWENIRIAA